GRRGDPGAFRLPLRIADRQPFGARQRRSRIEHEPPAPGRNPVLPAWIAAPGDEIRPGQREEHGGRWIAPPLQGRGWGGACIVAPDTPHPPAPSPEGAGEKGLGPL